MTNHQTAAIEWRDGGIPVSSQFDDPYFSIASGLEETRHVFLAGNDLPARLNAGFHVAELGFGTGLNLLALALMWQGEGMIKFTSFEAFPMDAGDMRTALDAFPEARAIADPMLQAWTQGLRQFQIENVEVEVILGDARETLSTWNSKADAWFLDGFSPAKNPELWGADLMAEVGVHTAKDGTFATYTAAGHVRKSLGDAGFDVSRVTGFGRKRHMSCGSLRGIETGHLA
ncbi:tRNA (5-methylaminomethyl-2-thiouridine)(34)-methyltransferase MnmD [Pacificibacter marinus]|uniref:tRNA 5-methylaminomethyl-2-thiouridine biosynthesis bifunctional protein MnmC n=1 Tax=Pacificibacter marinus TaxID=658057 RepID=A0A1Y5S3P2_9RHOB|nr:tRNA (5-methylaminomethyl-2-thiouridine)(34)-methyltransferase MnmD [Pacificibacter marinus]SEK91534.1 tRNA U34 5-methylaminomethyl-2-thiouridine-forming methyltransferase MnmC [Pacificibacter marinus]SLN31638.1 tRNA 5-methylaminomethyl-2-thiouridine biosynthesis bifunctional protein MnmC [Pacificibacter marinus]